jgi:hypothetical protein
LGGFGQIWGNLASAWKNEIASVRRPARGRGHDLQQRGSPRPRRDGI